MRSADWDLIELYPLKSELFLQIHFLKLINKNIEYLQALI